MKFHNRWIGKRGEIGEWPPRDLSPLGYILWDYLKGKVYATKLRNLEELRQRIIEETALIDSKFIRNAVSNFYDQIAHSNNSIARQ